MWQPGTSSAVAIAMPWPWVRACQCSIFLHYLHVTQLSDSLTALVLPPHAAHKPEVHGEQVVSPCGRGP